MRNQEWDSALAELDALDLAELVLGLLVLDAVDGEAALGVVDEAEVLASLLDGDDVHVAGGVGDVGADLAVDLDEALHHDGLGLAVVERILEPVTHEDDERHAVAELVRTSRRARGIDARQLVEKPVRGGAKALLVLLPVVREFGSVSSRCLISENFVGLMSIATQVHDMSPTSQKASLMETLCANASLSLSPW